MLDVLAIAAVRRGDENAFESLVRKYAPYVTTVVRGVGSGTMTAEDVEEVAADVFYALWQSVSKPNPLKLKEWLGGVARNKTKNRLRSMKEELPLEDDWIAGDGETFIDELAREDERNAVKKAVLSMKEPDREIFLRHYYQLQTVGTIASEMQMGESAIKSRLARGRMKLKARLFRGANTKPIKEAYSNEQENI
jgi:RNA polymerase sigma-70 factor (ECF subfamily)